MYIKHYKKFYEKLILSFFFKLIINQFSDNSIRNYVTIAITDLFL